VSTANDLLMRRTALRSTVDSLQEQVEAIQMVHSQHADAKGKGKTGSGSEADDAIKAIDSLHSACETVRTAGLPPGAKAANSGKAS